MTVADMNAGTKAEPNADVVRQLRALLGEKGVREQPDAVMPEIILLPNEPYAFSEDDWDSFARFGDVPAVANRQVFLCDGKALTWYGSRTVDALRTFSALLA